MSNPAATSTGPSALVVVTRDDGTSGASVGADLGGIVIVQDPDEAPHASMPCAYRPA